MTYVLSMGRLSLAILVPVFSLPAAAQNAASESGTGSTGKTVRIIASVPPTDHGWLGAISKNAKAAAKQHSDVKFELLQAADGEEALASAREHLPDLILLDVMMPKLDGIEVCRRLKGDTTLPFMPIILVTATADSKDVVAGLEAGADDVGFVEVDRPELADQPVVVSGGGLCLYLSSEARLIVVKSMSPAS